MSRRTDRQTAATIRAELRTLADPEHGEGLQRFFKTGEGEYGEGDRFIGLRVPQIRKIARAYRNLPLAQTTKLLRSDIHEERLLALVILVDQAKRGDNSTKKQLYEFYLDNTEHVNNWDLVDASAEHIVGAYLQNRSRRPLYGLAKSGSLWERRISIIATFYFIKNGIFQDTLDIADRLLGDKEDLIHKAVGWMLREVGNRDRAVEEAFLMKHYKVMPRTMLRYAIEKFPESRRKAYLNGTV